MFLIIGLFFLIFLLWIIGILISWIRYPERETNTVLADILFAGAAPLLGFAMLSDNDPEFRFLQADHLLSLSIPCYLSLLCYWVARYHRGPFSPLMQLILTVGLCGGIGLFIVISIHFLPLFLIGMLVPPITFPIYGPLVCILLYIHVLQKMHLRFKETYASKLDYEDLEDQPQDHVLLSFLLSPFWQQFPFLFVLALPVLAILESLLMLFGQKPDSLLLVFTESCEMVFSKYEHCYSATTEYVCSVAAHGSPALVRPVRSGVRGGKRIPVTRQLLICNAFEQWLSEKAPRLQRYMRRRYDALAIPVGRWARNRRLANFLYLALKPLEWLFLLWLYLVDPKPEDRIARQYIPAQYLDPEYLTQFHKNLKK